MFNFCCIWCWLFLLYSINIYILAHFHRSSKGSHTSWCLPKYTKVAVADTIPKHAINMHFHKPLTLLNISRLQFAIDVLVAFTRNMTSMQAEPTGKYYAFACYCWLLGTGCRETVLQFISKEFLSVFKTFYIYFSFSLSPLISMFTFKNHFSLYD